MSARSTTRVFTVGMSMPDSMIVVQTRTSYWPSQKSRTTRSSRPSSICPWATATRASGTSSRSRAATRSMSCTRLWTKKTWPSRSSSRRIDSPTARSSYSPT